MLLRFRENNTNLFRIALVLHLWHLIRPSMRLEASLESMSQLLDITVREGTKDIIQWQRAALGQSAPLLCERKQSHKFLLNFTQRMWKKGHRIRGWRSTIPLTFFK